MSQIFQIPLRVKIAFALYTAFFGTLGILFLILALNIAHGMTLFMAIIVCTLGWFPIGRVIFKKWMRKKMLQSGEIVYSTFVKVEPLMKGPFLGWQGYRVVTQWHDPETNLLYFFKSEIVSQDLTLLLNKIGDSLNIPVYIDRLNPKSQYYVDLAKVL